jgi:hypothetical protein
MNEDWDLADSLEFVLFVITVVVIVGYIVGKAS